MGDDMLKKEVHFMKPNGIKTAIVIVALLLVLSMLGLALVVMLKTGDSTTMTVSDNYIQPAGMRYYAPRSLTLSATRSLPRVETLSSTTTKGITLYRLFPRDNEKFTVTDLFPGDVITHRYTVNITDKKATVLEFSAPIATGYAKLAEVLCMRVSVEDTPLYNGLMKDVGQSIKKC